MAEERLNTRLAAGSTGPGYEPINVFLREMGKLTEKTRYKFACDPTFTYAATVNAICMAIRKLARCNPGESKLRPRWRGVRGVLPQSFWMPDSKDMVVVRTVWD